LPPNGLKPHLTRSFKVSNDPMFEAKVTDIVGLYLDPPERAVVLCVDEKSQIQALDRTQPFVGLRGHVVRNARLWRDEPRLQAPRHDHAGRGARREVWPGDRRMPAAPPREGVPAVPAPHSSGGEETAQYPSCSR
jgi:hypothetical protein